MYFGLDIIYFPNQSPPIIAKTDVNPANSLFYNSRRKYSSTRRNFSSTCYVMLSKIFIIPLDIVRGDQTMTKNDVAVIMCNDVVYDRGALRLQSAD